MKCSDSLSNKFKMLIWCLYLVSRSVVLYNRSIWRLDNEPELSLTTTEGMLSLYRTEAILIIWSTGFFYVRDYLTA